MIKPTAILDFFGPTDLNGILDDSKAGRFPENFDTIQDSLTKLLGGPVETGIRQGKDRKPRHLCECGQSACLDSSWRQG